MLASASTFPLRPAQLAQLTHGNQPSSPKTRNGSHNVQYQHALSYGTTKTSNHKGQGRDEEANSSPKHVRETAIQRLEGRACDQVGCRQPGCIIGGAKL